MLASLRYPEATFLMPFTLSAPCELLEVISKSRFLAKAAPVQSPEEAQAFIQAVSDPTATHNCWAWKIGNQYRFSDDGEPGGTAGRPMLTAIEGQDFDRVAVVVIRWFGGTKLGTGGLALRWHHRQMSAGRRAQRTGLALALPLSLPLRRTGAAQGAPGGFRSAAGSRAFRCRRRDAGDCPSRRSAAAAGKIAC